MMTTIELTKKINMYDENFSLLKQFVKNIILVNKENSCLRKLHNACNKARCISYIPSFK